MPEQPNSILHKGKQALRLAKKVGDELRDPRQLLSKSRRQQLIGNFFEHAKAITVKIDSDTQEIQEKFEKTLQTGTLENGLEITCPEKVKIVGIVFPETTQLHYFPPTKDSRDLSALSLHPDAILGRIFLTTTMGATPYPSEGFKTSQGVVTEFQKRTVTSRVQHGGIFIHEPSGRIELMNYEELQVAQKQEVGSDSYLIEANWFMSSENQNEVCALQNLQERRPYNALGFFTKPNGEKIFFTINSALVSMFRKKIGAPEEMLQIDGPIPTMREIAALCNIMMKQQGAVDWSIAGLEFHMGGTLIGHTGEILRGVEQLRRDFLVATNEKPKALPLDSKRSR